ncbi:MAG: T9SS type A sorting domain-containing protein [Candidatus Kapabacteria bacterium]|nr:T9SS type A sorting domain-containing protein [Candidatus Kapabacteria bacterium]
MKTTDPKFAESISINIFKFSLLIKVLQRFVFKFSLLTKEGLMVGSILLFFVFFSTTPSFSFKNNEYNIWYFGDEQLGMSWNTPDGSPKIIKDNQLPSNVCGTICDSLGNLLFYNNSMFVKDKNQNLMPGSYDLLGCNGSNCNMVVHIPNSSIYYIFYILANGVINSSCFRQGLKYSTIDLSQNNGLGLIINSGIILNPDAFYSFDIARHKNGKDFWVVCANDNLSSKSLSAFLVTETGVSINPIKTVIDDNYLIPPIQPGWCRFTQDNRKFCLDVGQSSNFYNIYIFDFDNSTGSFSNIIRLEDTLYAERFEFSPDCSKLYTSANGGIHQYDLSSNNQTIIQHSVKNIVPRDPLLPRFTGMSLGPDGKIYLSELYIGVINKPNEIGDSCDFYYNNQLIQNQLIKVADLPKSLSGTNYIEAHGKSDEKEYCEGDTVRFFGDCAPDATYRWTGPNNYISRQQNATIPNAKPENSGLYYLSASSKNLSGWDTVSVIIHPKPKLNVQGCDPFCVGQSSVLSLIFPDPTIKYKWSTGDSIQSITVTKAGRYYVYEQSQYGCTHTDSIDVQTLDLPKPIIEGKSGFCPGDSVILSFSSTFSEYLWSTGARTYSIIVKTPGRYWLYVKNENNCEDSSYFDVKQYTPPQPSITGKTVVCSGRPETLTADKDYKSYLWNDGTTKKQLQTDKPGTYSLLVTDSNGCTGATSIEVKAGTAPTLIITGDSTLCQGSSSQLTAISSDPTVKYQWSGPNTTKNDTLKQYTAVVPGFYVVTVTDLNGCTATAQISILETNTNLLFTNSYNFGKTEIFKEKDAIINFINNSSDTAILKSFKLKNNLQFKIKSTLNQINQTSHSSEISFIPDDYYTFYDTLQIEVDKPCPASYSITLSGTGTGKMQVWLPDVVDGRINQGTTFPLSARMLTNKALTTDFNSEISLDYSYLRTDAISNQVISYVNNDIKINYSNKNQKFETNPTILTNYSGLVLLAPTSQTPLSITKFEITNPNIEIVTKGGILIDSGICAGDLRRVLITTPTTMIINPNPSNDNDLEIGIESGASGNFTLELYSIEGVKVYSQGWNQELIGNNAQKRNFTINHFLLSNGVYFVRLNAGSEQLIEKIFVIK